MKKEYFIVLIFILLIPFSGWAQKNTIFFDFSGGEGILIPHSKMKFMGGPVSFLNARLGFQTMGAKEWQRVHHYPQFGVGLSKNFLTTRSLGNPNAVYSFLYLPLSGQSKVKINFGMHLGLAWGYNPYKELYPTEIVIGSALAFYTSFNFNFSFPVSERFELLLAAEAYHISNGNTNKPNKGINMFGAEAGVRYRLLNSDVEKNTDPITPVEKKTSVILFGSAGWMKGSTSYTERGLVGSLNAGIYRTINHKSRLSAGLDLFYDEGNIYETQMDNQLRNILASGIFGGHELTLNKLSIVTQAGIYLTNPAPTDPFYYTRLGLRYTIARRIIPSVTMKAHGLEVDFIEWGVGIVLWNS